MFNITRRVQYFLYLTLEAYIRYNVLKILLITQYLKKNWMNNVLHVHVRVYGISPIST